MQCYMIFFYIGKRYYCVIGELVCDVWLMFYLQDSELNELRATIEALKRQSGLSIQDAQSTYSNGSSSGRRNTTPGMLGKDLNTHHSQGGRVFHTLPMPAGKSANHTL